MIINNIIKGRLIKRYKRFLADIEINNPKNVNEKIVITAHCPNSGSMKSLIDKNPICYITKSDSPKRKLKYTLQIIQLKNKTGYALVNTMLPNHIVYEGIEEKKISMLKNFKTIEREKKYGKENSRIDILTTTKDNNKNYVEVKNVTLLEEELPKVAQFPDSVTTRGQKHLRELSYITNLTNDDGSTNSGYIFYLVNRTDCTSFKVALHIDPDYEKELVKAKKMGVNILIYNTKIEFYNKNKSVLIKIDKKLKYYQT